jgi:glycosyltransferase involved in cell wall biosynthesis
MALENIQPVDYPAFSLIIPAHNEAEVISEGLESLDFATRCGEVIIVCNGCQDHTAQVARRWPHVKVIETDVASKTHALNLGDQHASAFPRFYVDADVRLTPQDVEAMVATMRESSAPLVSPRIHLDLAGASRGVRGYYDAWRATPYVQAGMMGTGVYGLSEQGRQRFEAFPEVTADDGYVRLLFRPEERAVASEAVSRVRPPATLRDLVKIKTRSRLGEYELKECFPHLKAADRKAYGTAIGRLVGTPRRWPQTAVYLWVNCITRLRASRQHRSGGTLIWERDHSSRQQSKPPSQLHKQS